MADNDDDRLRWGPGKPTEPQRVMEEYAATMFLRLAGARQSSRDDVFVEGMVLNRPLASEDMFRAVAGSIFAECRAWHATMDVKESPHSLFVVGCGPNGAAMFRIVAFDVYAMLRAGPSLARALGAKYAIVLHSSIMAVGRDGRTELGAADRLIVKKITDAGGGAESLPWGYRRVLVGRMFGGAPCQELPWSWVQVVGAEGGREEVSPSVFAPYHVVDLDAQAADMVLDA